MNKQKERKKKFAAVFMFRLTVRERVTPNYRIHCIAYSYFLPDVIIRTISQVLVIEEN